jgi:AcrR family transcriptional regulator
MKNGSKKHEVRKQELIETASRLFLEKGYEAVSVRDILDVVDGSQGMFYHYFKSKQDIFLAAMSQYIDSSIAEKVTIIQDDGMSFQQKQKALHKSADNGALGFLEAFGNDEEQSVENDAHRTRLLVEMVDKLHKPYAGFILQGIREGYITGVSEKSVNVYSLFVLYGMWGVMHNDSLNHKPANGYRHQDIAPIIQKIFSLHA